MFPIKRTVFFSSVTVVKNTVRLIGNIEYLLPLTSGHQKFSKISVFKVDNFVLSIFLVPKLRSVSQIEWKKHPYLFFLLLVQK